MISGWRSTARICAITSPSMYPASSRRLGASLAPPMGRHETILWRLRNELAERARTTQGADRRFVPREGHVTGRIDILDIGVGRLGAMAVPGPIFVNTLYGCLATVSETASFRPL
jgi:hypothetical protein